MFPEVLGIIGRLLPPRHIAPFVNAGTHVATVANTEEECAPGAVGIFVQFPRWMDHKRARDDVDQLRWGPHRAPAGKAEIDFSRLRMAVIWAHLPWLPARYGDIAAAEHTQYLLDVVF